MSCGVFQDHQGRCRRNGICFASGFIQWCERGDQFLLSDNPAILNQVLGKDGLQGLGLAEIQRVNERTAVLTQIAGPPLRELSRYKALLSNSEEEHIKCIEIRIFPVAFYCCFAWFLHLFLLKRFRDKFRTEQLKTR